VKAVALISGGLDSLLAVKLVEEQEIDVLPLHIVTPFAGRLDASLSVELENRYGIKECVLVDMQKAFLPLLRNPPHGFGKHMNPCIDCKILFFKKAREIMEQAGASFILTGEVVGQRPMSQRTSILPAIDKAAGVEGILLRPLSARLLPPTVPEKEGWVERERLEAIRGRGRGRQLELASKFGWKEIPSPAGGCLLTDPGFSNRLRDLLDHMAPVDLLSLVDLELLRLGRHFRISPDTKLVVGRREDENDVIRSLAMPDDTVLLPQGFPGPTGLLKGEQDSDILRLAASIMARYCKGEGPFRFRYEGRGEGEVEVVPLPAQEVDRWLVT
jgi:hypothetical protein